MVALSSCGRSLMRRNPLAGSTGGRAGSAAVTCWFDIAAALLQLCRSSAIASAPTEAAGGMPSGSGQFRRAWLARGVYDLLALMRAPALDTAARNYSVCGGASIAQLGSAPNG